MRRRRRSAICPFVTTIVLMGCLACCQSARADSALMLLGGFDAQRIDNIYPPTGEESLGELSKLIFRLRAVDPKSLESRIEDEPAMQLGEALRWQGTIDSIARLDVPAGLREFLEIDRLEVIDMTSDETAIRVITTELSHQAAVGDRVAGIGVLIETASQGDQAGTDAAVVAAPRAKWYPASAQDIGWQLLSGQGFDLGSLTTVANRDKQPLMAADGDAFYRLIAAADTIGKQSGDPPPQPIQPITMLQSSQSLAGHWVRLRLETVQITRVAVTQPQRQQQLGGDHYYQIDAVGDLGKVAARIERPAGDDRPDAIFEGRYPVSIVSRELPDFLAQQMRQRAGGQTLVAQVGAAITVDAFFFRLWSYSSQYMDRYGGGEQLGPLLVAARVSDAARGEDPLGAGVIAWWAAGGVLVAILAIFVWDRTITRRDREIREKRKQSEAEQFVDLTST